MNVPQADEPVNSRPDVGGDMHLSSEQMGELLDRAFSGGEAVRGDTATETVAEAHLRECAVCAAEFASLRETLSLFQEASIAHADREFGRMQLPAMHRLAGRRAAYTALEPMLWLAAAGLLLAALLPMELRWQHALRGGAGVAVTTSNGAGSSSTSNSNADEALLEDINRDLTASVPAPMQALADPTGASTAQASLQSGSQTSTQRKD
jgi:hypothetical protein